ncbi:MAG: GAF domain-containing protein [Anaerolineae bacterium]|nr:GAF domain-containing protein [Anaerolineae bacterium]
MIDQIPQETTPPLTKPEFKSRLARSMVLALLTFTVIPISIMGLVGFLRARNLHQDQVSLQIHSIVDGQADTFDQSMNTKDIRLARIGRRPGFQEAAENLIRNDSSIYRKQLLEEFEIVNRPEGQPLFQSFFIMNPEGEIYASTDFAWQGVSLAESPYYPQITGEADSVGLFGLSPLFPEEFYIFTTKPIQATTGEDLGILVGLTGKDAIKDFLNETTLFNPSTSAYIISSNGVYIGIDPYTKQLVTFDPSQEQQNVISSFLESPPLGEEDEIYNLLDFENNLEIPVVAQSHEIASAHSQIVLEIPYEIAFGQLTSLAPFFIFLFMITLIAMGVVLWVASNRIVRPIQDLSETARKFSEGDWLARFFVKRKDEIGELAYSFNQMADDLSTLYQSLQSQVEERTEYIRTASEVAQSIASTFNLDELFGKTTRLIVERFGYYHAGIFMVERSGTTAILKSAFGPSAQQMLERGHRLDVGSASIVGWVTKNNQPRAASDVGDDPVHFRNDLLPETRAEVGIPIAIGETVLGVLDVQSTHSEAFDDATIEVLVTLSNQIATAIQNVDLFKSSDVNVYELDRLYRASREIARENTIEGTLNLTGRILQNSPFISAIFTPKGKGLGIFSASDPDQIITLAALPEYIDIQPGELTERIRVKEDLIIDLGSPTTLPKEFINIPRKFGCQAISLLPLTQGGKFVALIMIGSRQNDYLTETAVQPYTNFIEMIAITLDKIKATELTDRRLAELEAISLTSQAVIAAKDLNSLYPSLHEQSRQVLGDYPFAVALYDEVSSTINIPYNYEAGTVSSVPSFSLGEGLTSVIIRTAQPLMIVEETEMRSAALGAVLDDKPPKSWLGCPLLVSRKVIGAIIVQDFENENSFDENSLRFLKSLTAQVSGAIYNIQLLEESHKRAIQLESAAEIARDISGSLNLDELLNNAVTMIQERFSFYHAAIFLVDHLQHYAVIREATGEAGAQLKRNGFRLGVGSNSPVGYVSGHGEALTIDNTETEPTYQENPLLPNTRAETAIPLKIGERILGVLDVHSNEPYAFSQEIIQTLNIIADQLAVGINNTELFAETQEHLSQHRLIHHITTSAASGTTLEEALNGAVQGLQVTLGGDRVAILLANNKQEKLTVGAAIGYSEEDIAEINIPFGSGITGWVARNKKLLRIDDAPTDSRYFAVSANTRSELAIPLIFRSELLGVLNVESEQEAAYDEHDEEMLGTLAGSLAAIIANARLLQQVRRRAERDRTLHDITSKIRSSTNVQTILSTTATELNKAIGAQHTQVKVGVEHNSETEGTNE